MARSGNAMTGIGGLGKFTELRQRLLFVLGALIVYRIGCYIPVPGVKRLSNSCGASRSERVMRWQVASCAAWRS